MLLLRKAWTYPNCPDLKRKKSSRSDNSKSLAAWSNEDGSEDELPEATNICFMSLGETSEMRKLNCSNYHDLQKTIDMITSEL